VNILLTNATSIFAGGEDYVLILARYLQRRGHAVSVSALPDHLLLAKCAAAGIPVVPVEYRGMDRVFAVSAHLRREMRARAIQIVHSNANYDRTCAALATAWSPVCHVAGIHSTHSIQHNLTHWMRNRWGIDHFVTDADAGRDVLIAEDGIRADRITTVPIGIEDEPEDRRRTARVAARALLGVHEQTVVIGNVARLVPFKGHHDLLETIAEVVRHSRDVLFPIIGDGELLHTLQLQAQRLRIEQHVRFLGFQDNLHEWYPAFDIYCHSSLELAAEMFPIAILRALATSLPVVCTDVGGIALMVEQHVSGILVPPADPRALATALLGVINDGGLRERMGCAGHERFLQRFHAAAMAERMEQVYTNVREAEHP
jgi:glycosyltransferase involved in cell wall biosynthesis